MDSKGLIINVERLAGKNRTKNGRDTFLCLGVLDLSKDSQDKSAIKLNTKKGWQIDKFRCSKCYLCKLKSKFIALDEEHFPYITNKEDRNTYELNVDDQIHFESNLATYSEESGISKWIYSIFRFFGLVNTFTECSISKEDIPQEVLKKLGKIKEDDVYKKGVRVDVEGNLNEFVFVFENKKYSTGKDDWIIEAIKQIILYSSSKIYQEKTNDIVFIFCYNGSLNIKNRIMDIIKNNPSLEIFYEIFKKPNYSFSLIPSSEFFNLIENAIKTNKKDKEEIIKLILSKKEELPLK